MSEKQQSPAKMPIYNNADFVCERCDSTWKIDYTEIAQLRKGSPINCKQCRCELAMTDEDLATLQERFAQSEKLSKLAVLFIFPYLIICVIVGFTYGGVFTAIMIAAGFIILMTMRSSLTKNGIDRFVLRATKIDIIKEKEDLSNKKNQLNKSKKRNKTK